MREFNRCLSPKNSKALHGILCGLHVKHTMVPCGTASVTDCVVFLIYTDRDTMYNIDETINTKGW